MKSYRRYLFIGGAADRFMLINNLIKLFTRFSLPTTGMGLPKTEFAFTV